MCVKSIKKVGSWVFQDDCAGCYSSLLTGFIPIPLVLYCICLTELNAVKKKMLKGFCMDSMSSYWQNLFLKFEYVCQTWFEKSHTVELVDRLNNRCVFLKYILTFLVCVEFLNVLVSVVLQHITINISFFFYWPLVYFINFDICFYFGGFQSHFSSK
jgi:hypothetical protein